MLSMIEGLRTGVVNHRISMVMTHFGTIAINV